MDRHPADAHFLRFFRNGVSRALAEAFDLLAAVTLAHAYDDANLVLGWRRSFALVDITSSDGLCAHARVRVDDLTPNDLPIHLEFR